MHRGKLKGNTYLDSERICWTLSERSVWGMWDPKNIVNISRIERNGLGYGVCV